MKFKLEIEIKGDAFAEDCWAEVSRILRRRADRMEREGADPGESGPLVDVNGNLCGKWLVTKR